MALGVIGAASVLKYKVDSGSLVLIGNVTNISGPNATADAVDVTSLGDTDKKFIQGLRDGGDMTISLNYDPALSAHQALQAYLDDNNAATLGWSLEYAGGDKIVFEGPLVAVSPTNSTDGLVTMDITIKVSGAIDWPGAA